MKIYRPDPRYACLNARACILFYTPLKLGEEHAQAQQVTVCMKVARRAKRVVMLSGTPSLSKPFDLFNQVESSLRPPILRDRVAGNAGISAKQGEGECFGELKVMGSLHEAAREAFSK